MGVNPSDRHASVRAVTGTANNYEGDWHALFDGAGIATGDFNGRLLQWINTKLSASYTNLPSAQTALAISVGPMSWDQLGTFGATTGFTPSLDFSDARNSQYAAIV